MYHHARSIGPVFAWLALAALAGGQITTCPGSGLSVVGGRFGDPWSIAIFGPPNASAVLASDVASGPVITPFGSVCLGLTPSLVTMPLTLDSTGAFSQLGVLPLAAPFVSGSTMYTQAALAHPTLPAGYAFTNGAAVTFRPPRIGVFRWVGTAYTFDSIDAVTDTVTVSMSVPAWQGVYPFHVPRLGWYGWRRLNSGDIDFVDDVTGANVQTVPAVAPSGGAPSWQTVVPNDDGSLLFAIGLGPNDLVVVNTWSRVTGALVSTWSQSIPFFSFRGLYPIPGTALVYTCNGTQILVIDGATGTLVTTIALPGYLHGQYEKYAFLAQGLLYAITTPTTTVVPGLPQTSALLVVVDPSTHTIVGTPAPILGSAIQPLAIAPGSTGAPAFWLSVGTPAGPMLTEVSLSTFAASPVAPLIPGPVPVFDCVPSTGGTELVLLEGNAGQASVVNVATGQVTPILNGVSAIAVLRSGTLTKAYALYSQGVIAFPTDPVGPVTGIGIPSWPPTAFVWYAGLVSN